MKKTFYEILEVSSSASPEIVGMAYQSLRKKYSESGSRGDPDAGDELKFLSVAHRVISDPNQRSLYDSRLAQEAIQRQSAANPVPQRVENVVPHKAIGGPHPSQSRTTVGLERIVFSVARVLGIFFAAAFVVAIVILTIGLLVPEGRTHISYDEVVGEMSRGGSREANPDSVGGGKQPVEIPDGIKPYLRGPDTDIVLGLINTMTRSQRIDFLSNLWEIINAAEAKNADVSNAIHAYRSLKLQKLRESELTEYASKAENAAYIGASLILLILLTSVALVLAMLAIRRNTRPVGKTVDE